MVYKSPYLSSDTTPPRIEIVEEELTPWSDILLDNVRTSLRPGTPRRLSDMYKYKSNRTSRARLRCWTRFIWLAIACIVIVWWILDKGRQTVGFDMEQLYSHSELDGLKFIDATHPDIRYVGRWTTSSDGTHKDGAFAGVYFDFTINGSSTVFLSLRNSDEKTPNTDKQPSRSSPRLSFLPLANASNASPISLLARVDDNEYIVLSNATKVVVIRREDLSPSSRHEIRIIAPMVDQINVLQFEGLWVEEGGTLLPSRHGDGKSLEVTKPSDYQKQYKLLETITDISGSKAVLNKQKNAAQTRSVLGGVMGWEYLLGDMFGADHVTIGMDDMCLIQNCIGGKGSPVGLADVFFQSGPLETPQYAQPWHFQDYVPDVMVLNIGSSDWDSFQTYTQEYNKTLWELSGVFEETYVSMIKAIRALAYPKYSSSAIDTSRYSFATQSSGTSMPIFVMRPFRGQLEQATHAVVERLQKEGDKSIFWLDTSGWLNTEVNFEGRPEDQDFFLDDQSPLKPWRLTERGNQRAAVLLHMHVCRYLAKESEKCVFLPPEVYQGKAMDHEAIRLSDFLDEERERKLKKLFWV